MLIEMDNDGIPPPYPGLRPFEMHESLIFFGRASSIFDLLHKFRTRTFVAIVGPSGCGKSSLVRAGLVPALKNRVIPSEGDRWDFAIMRPGDDPLDNLARAIKNSLPLGFENENDEQRIAAIRSKLQWGPSGLTEMLQTHREVSGHNFLLVVDQFEEIFRSHFNGRDDLIEVFVRLLLETANSDVAHVIVTMRSDFIGDCTRFWGLPEAMNAGQYLVPRLSREELSQAIEKPAVLHGATVEEKLIERVLNEVENEPDQLALMQHTLRRIWERVTQKSDAHTANTRLAFKDHEAVGGIRNAMAIHADEILDQLDDAAKKIAEKMFRRMCDEAGPGRAVRRPVRLQEIADVAQVSIEQVAIVAGAFSKPDGNLLVSTTDNFTPDTVLDIAHEALLRNWPRLREWIADRLIEKGARVFYDKYEQSDLWGKDLFVHLNSVYGERAQFCLILISQHYARKQWTNHERKAAQSRAFSMNEEYILPLKLDDTEIPGLLPTVGYVDLRQKSLDEVVELLVQKLKL